MAQQKEYMLSGLERELELYMGEEYEDGGAGATKDYQWKDNKGIERVTKLEINPDRTGKIVVPEYYDDKGNLIPGATNEFKNIEKSSDGTRIYGNPKGGPEQLWTVRITIVSNKENSKVLVDKRSPLPLANWKPYQDPASITESTANMLIGWVKTLTVPTRTSDLEMEHEYESRSPTNVFEKIVAKVDYINDSSLTRKPVQNTPVEITFDYDLRRKRLTMSAKQLDIHYIYDVKDFERLKSNAYGTRIEGEGKALKRGPSLFEILDTADKNRPVTLTIGIFASPFPAQGGYPEQMLKNDRYILEQAEAQKLKNMFVELLKAGHIGTVAQGEFEFDDDEFEFDDIEEDDELSYEYEYEEDEEPDDEFEFEFENELNTLEDNGVTENFARRLYELSTRSYESEYELDEELDRALDDVEDEFMVKRLHRKKKRGKRKGLFKKILGAGAKIVGKIANKTPIGSLIKAGTSLVRGNIKGALGNLAKAAVGTVLPPGVGTVATAAMDALGGGEEGGEGGEEGEVRRGGRRKRAIMRVARIARDTYREVADTLPEDFDHPLVANEVARKAVQKAMIKNGVRPPGKAEGIPRQKRVIKLRPGEKIVIIRS